MKLLIFISFTFLFSQQSWESYSSYEGRFTISVPGRFQEKADSIQTGLGTMVYHTHFYKSEDMEADNHIYMVSYCDYPEDIIFTDSIGLVEEFFQESMDAAAGSVNGKLIYHSDISLGDHPGMFWRIDYRDGEAVIKTRAYLVGNRYYSLQVISFRKNNLNLSTERFFDSFKLL